ALEAKRLGLLHELNPKAATIAVLVNTNFSDAENQLRDVQEAAPRLRVQFFVVRANAESESSRSGLGRSSSAHPHSSTAGAGTSPYWRPAARCRRSTNGAGSPKAAG